MLDCQPSLLCYSSQSSLLTLSRGQKDLLSTVSRQGRAGRASLCSSPMLTWRQDSALHPTPKSKPNSTQQVGYWILL